MLKLRTKYISLYGKRWFLITCACCMNLNSRHLSLSRLAYERHMGRIRNDTSPYPNLLWFWYPLLLKWDFLRNFALSYVDDRCMMWFSYNKPATILLYFALLTILLGACVTHFFGEQGEIHLRADKAQSLNLKHSTLSLFLWDFQVVSDDHGNPADYITELRLLDRGKSQITNHKLSTTSSAW